MTSAAQHVSGTPAREPRPPTHPKIHMELGKPHEWIASTIEALRADPDLYTRDDELAHVTRVTEEESAASEWTDSRGRTHRALTPGSPKIHTMSLATLRVRMCRWASWTKTKVVNGKDGPGFAIIPTEPTKDAAEAVRDERHWPGLRRLVGVSETPFPRPDLSIVQGAAHWDLATMYLYEPSMRFPPVPDAPTREDAAASLRALEDLFADFPFASPAGKSGAIALMMTLIARPAILGPVPAWVIDATTPGTGKTLLADVCAAVALGRDAGRTHFPSGRNGDEELGKRLGMLARMGVPLVCFDNADEATIGGDVLEEVISTPSVYTFRILGKTDGLTLLVRMIFAFTANNATWGRGMNRRILHVRLESPFADPEHRPADSYAHPERAGRLLAYALEHRAEYVAHVLTILRAFAVAGRPVRLSVGTFEAWAALVPSALVWAGGEAWAETSSPMLCRPGADGEESPEAAQRATMAREWVAFCQAVDATDVTAHTVIERVYPRREHGEALDPRWDTFRGAIEFFVPPKGSNPPDPAKLGECIRRQFAGASLRTHDAPAPLRRFARAGKSGGRARWRVEDVPAYTAKSGEVATDEPEVSEAERGRLELIERLRREEAEAEAAE